MSAYAAGAAAPVYEITAEWAPDTPTTVAKGDVVTGVWRVNVNDSAPAPGNEPVDNVNFSVTLTHGTFKSVPDACLTTAVDPVSSISADSATLLCNLGTQQQGTAAVVQTAVVADGATGDELSAIGTIAGQTANLAPIPTDNPFGMDMLWGTPSPAVLYNANTVDLDFEWTLNLTAGADAGPDSVSYTLTVAAENGSTVAVGPQACAAFTTGVADGHPWSGGDHNSSQLAPFVDSCTLTKTGPTTFTLTLTGIDYSGTQVPTKSSTGGALPTDLVAVASGSVWFRVTTATNTGLSLSSTAPTYTAPGGGTAEDDPANNISSKSIIFSGANAGAWQRSYTGAGGVNWDDTYRVAPGTIVRGTSVINYNSFDAGQDPESLYGTCVVLDSQFTTYSSHVLTPLDTSDGVVEYYIGNDPTVTPGSGSYNPNLFDCGTGGADVGGVGWTTAVPGNLATIKAVRVNLPFRQGGSSSIQVAEVIDANAAPGQDIWTFASYRRGGGAWINPRRDITGTPETVNPTPNARYPYTTGSRDILRVVSVTPTIEKSADRASLTPGVPAVYTLGYAANGTGAPATVDDFQIVDTLPAGMTYVAGSAEPAPVVSSGPDGVQLLTWTLDAVPTNAVQELTYEAMADDSVTPGQTLTNTAVATVQGQDSAPATADVTVSTAGFTMILKSADEPYIPNLTGDGNGTGGWTVTLRSQDPLPQAWTDTIDVLPYHDDDRGTSYSGSYTVTSVTAAAGATVYYTNAPAASLSLDPGDPSNGSAGDVAGNTVGWSTSPLPDATAIRVIGGELAPGATQQFGIQVTTAGVQGGDTLVNVANARTSHTELVMKTSATLTVANYYSALIKKYVQGVDGEWYDANDAAEYPAFHIGDTVNYRVVVTNTGQGTLTNVVVSDDLQPDLGAFTVASLAPGATETHEYSVALDDAGSDSVVNTACATADTPEDSQVEPTINCDPAGIDVTNYVTVKTADPASGTPAGPGQTINYTITVTQQGSAPADAVLTDDLADVLDDADYNGDMQADIGEVTVDGSNLAWSGTVPVGGVATITYSVTVRDVAGLTADGNADLVNPVTSPGCVPVDGQFPGCTTDHPVGWFTFSKVADPASGTAAAVGDTINYTIVVVQHGTAAVPEATLTDDLANVLDDATYNDDVEASAGEVVRDGSAVTWTGDLAVGQTVSITYSVTVTQAASTTGDAELINPVTSEDPRGSCDEEIGCETVHPVGWFTFSKVADPASGTAAAVGDTINYTIVVVQHGTAAVPEATLTDDLTNVLDDATYNDDVEASAGEVVRDGSAVTWTGDLAVGQTASITYSVTVTQAATTTGDAELINPVTSEDPRGSCDEEIGCETVHPVGWFTFSKVADPASGTTTAVGDTINYTIAVTQHGKAAVPEATLTDDLTDVLDDATFGDHFAASAGTAVLDGSQLSWAGDLAVGATVTVTYSVTVTGDGSKELINPVTSDDARGSCDTDIGCRTVHPVDPAQAVAPVDPPPVSINTGDAGAGAGPNTTMVLTGSALLLLMLAGSAYYLVVNRRRAGSVETQIG